MANATVSDAAFEQQPLAGPDPAANLTPAQAPARQAPARQSSTHMSASPGEGAGHIIYRASRGRRFTFTAVFLLLLPFYVSLGPMLWSRVSHGHWTGTTGLFVLAVAFSVIMFLVLVEMLQSIRSEVELGSKAVRLTLPSGRGPQPMLRYRTYEIPYADIAAIEERREVYGGAWAPMMLKGARILMKNGENIRLGYINEANADPSLPFPEIAHRIANRAGVEIVDAGSVHRWATKKFLGIRTAPKQSRTIDEIQLAELNRSHARLMFALFVGLAVLVLLGVLGDLMQPG